MINIRGNDTGNYNSNNTVFRENDPRVYNTSIVIFSTNSGTIKTFGEIENRASLFQEIDLNGSRLIAILSWK